MQITLRCAYVTPHPDGAQTVGLIEERQPVQAPKPPAPKKRGAAKRVLVPPSQPPVPAPFMPVVICVSSWPGEAIFKPGEAFTVSIESAASSGVNTAQGA